MPPRKGLVRMHIMSFCVDWQTKQIIRAFAKKRGQTESALLRIMVKKQIDDMYLDIGEKIDK